MQYMKNKYLLTLIILSLLISCTTELDLSEMDKTIQLNSSLAIPLGTTTLTVSKLFSGEFGDLFRIDETANNVAIFWSDTLNYSVDDEFNNFTEGTYLTSSFAAASNVKVFPPIGSLNINKTMADELTELLQTDDNYLINYDYGFNRQENGETTRRIDSLYINSLNLNLDINLRNITGITPSDSHILLKIAFPTIPNLDEQTIIVNSNSHSETINLRDFKLIFSGEETIIPVSIKLAFMVPEGKFITVYPTSDIITTLLISEIDADKVWGYFNTTDNLIDASLEIEIPEEIYNSNNLQNNRLLFHNPMIALDIEGDSEYQTVQRITGSMDNARKY